MRRDGQLPELLAPAGSFDALVAAVSAGADAVYFGGGAFHARAMAKNFDADEMVRALLYCKLHRVKAYITLNTLLFDRELDEAVSYATFLYEHGADALICADLGLTQRLHKALPDMPIHASTQAFVHNVEGAELLYEMGAERVVVARELPARDIQEIIDHSHAEVEMFLHGALCVCHSGQCLFSSAVGGRSGNRGLCAQPCRLPYNNDTYPLSLKDLALAPYVPELIASGVSSLKIEGRMKSPTYVYHTTRLYRRLLDEGRGATQDEIDTLKAVFCRGEGFTDLYYKDKPLLAMSGVRSDAQKAKTRELADVDVTPERVKIQAKIEILPQTPAIMSLKWEGIEVGRVGEIPQPAQKAPLSKEYVAKQMAKLGDSFFMLSLDDMDIHLADGLFMTASQLNALRRACVEGLERAIAFKAKTKWKDLGRSADCKRHTQNKDAYEMVKDKPTAVFYKPDQLAKLSPNDQAYFAVRYIPLEKWQAHIGANGVVVPPAVFPHEWEQVKTMLATARAEGAIYALVSSLAQCDVLVEMGFVPVGDLRSNVTSAQTKAVYLGRGMPDVILSPELTLPQARDVGGRVVVYGRLPLMLLERCVMRETVGCKDNCECHYLSDRTGAKFPLFRSYPHRNLLFNSLPTYMCDKFDQLKKAKLNAYHFIFTIESAQDIHHVLCCAKAGKSLDMKVKRFPSEKV